MLGIRGQFRSQVPCSTHHPRESDASLRHKTSSTRITSAPTSKSKELSQCIFISHRALLHDRNRTNFPANSITWIYFFPSYCSQNFLEVSLQPQPHAVLPVPLPHQRQTWKTTWIWRFSLVGYKKKEKEKINPAADPFGSVAAPMGHTAFQQAKGELWKAHRAPSWRTTPGGTMSRVVLQVLGCRQHLLCKAREIIKKGWVGATPPAETWGAAASAYGRKKLEGFTAHCTSKAHASRWHRQTINPSAGCRSTAGPAAFSPAAILHPPRQHSTRCNTLISIIILH